MTSKTISKKAVSKVYNNVLVLSGGGMRGFAHLGVLEILIEEKYTLDYVIGTSIGAMLGVCYCAGKSIEDIKEFFFGLSSYKLLRPKWRGGLFDSAKLVQEVLDFAQVKKFSDLKIPLVMNATDINTGEEKVFEKGDLLPALQATIAVPGLFAPVKIGSKTYVDGGISNPLPVYLAPKAKRVFVVDVAFKFEPVTPRSNPLTVLKNAIFSLQRQSLQFITDDMIYIKPPLQKFDLYDYGMQDRKKMFSRGKSAARRVLNTL